MRPAGPLLVGLLATLPTTVHSQDLEVTPVVGFRYGGANTNTTPRATFEPGGGFELADAGSFGIHVGYGVGGAELELLYARQNTRVQSKDLFAGVGLFDVAVESVQLGASFLFREDDSRVRPFIGVAIGLTRLLPEPEELSHETRFSFSLGAGTKLWLADRFGVRLEARWFATVLDSEHGAFRSYRVREVSVGTSQLISQADLRVGLVLRF